MYVLGVYLPYNDGGKEEMELYLDTLGQLQLDQSDSEVPTIIMGDFNTVLPDTESPTEKWYCRNPYHKRSGILYEFLVKLVCVFLTFYSDKVLSNRDHIIVPRYLCEKFLDCIILNKAEDNVSDYFALNASVDVTGVNQDDENLILGQNIRSIHMQFIFRRNIAS